MTKRDLQFGSKPVFLLKNTVHPPISAVQANFIAIQLKTIDLKVWMRHY